MLKNFQVSPVLYSIIRLKEIITRDLVSIKHMPNLDPKQIPQNSQYSQIEQDHLVPNHIILVLIGCKIANSKEMKKSGTVIFFIEFLFELSCFLHICNRYVFVTTNFLPSVWIILAAFSKFVGKFTRKENCPDIITIHFRGLLIISWSNFIPLHSYIS